MPPKDRRYKDSQVQGMVINPYVSGEIYATYPFLKDMIPEDTFAFVPNKFFRYLSWVYDPASPMAKDFSDLGTRKKEAAREVDMRPESDEQYRLVALAFLKMIKKPVWTLICCNEMVFEDYTDKVTQPMTGDGDAMLKAVERQGNMLERMKKMIDTSTSLRKEFFAGDQVLEEQERLSPEVISRQMRNKS